MYIIDASAFLDSLLHETCAARLEQLAATAPLAVPNYFYIEVLNGLRHLEKSGNLGADQIEFVLGMFADPPFAQHDTAQFSKEIWALRHNISSYDAGYVILAKHLNATLITHDKRLRSAVGKFLQTIDLNAPESSHDG
jgi:predicted nucleic acid-binding protein